MKIFDKLQKSLLGFAIQFIKFIFLFVIMLLSLKGWFYYQRNYVCAPKIRREIDSFIKEVMAKEYDNLLEKYKSAFTNEKHFYSIKKYFSKKYTVIISYWGPIWHAYCIVSFDGNHKFGFILVPSEEPLFFTGKIKYSIKSIKEIKI